MLTTLFQILIAVFIVSFVSFTGIFLLLKESIIKKYLFYLVSFAAGSMLGAAFLDLLPEAFESGFKETVPIFILIGILTFFAMEKFLHWHHHHTGKKEVHVFNYLNTIGDGLHNFLDGAIIAVSFLSSTKLGIVVTIAVVAHEIPQEIGDFAILIYGGWSRLKASVINFLTALTAVIGALAAYFYSGFIENSSLYIMSFAIGGFIYIAGTDLIPEIQKETEIKKSGIQFALMILGILAIFLVAKIFENV